MQRKRRGFKKDKEEIRSGGKGGDTVLHRHLLFALPLSLRKETFRFSSKRRAEDALDAKEMKNKKERQRQRKSREPVPLDVISFLVFLFLWKKNGYIFPQVRRDEVPLDAKRGESPGKEKENEKVVKRQRSIPQNVISLLVFLSLWKKDTYIFSAH